jgi:CubicO group peptidase (beta-lactamase class C family)
VTPGFERVRDVFADNFVARGELGASCAVTLGGELVVDLWGGHTTAARTTAWSADTLHLVYSLSKGMSGLAAAVASSRGYFRYDDPVADVWPEFGANGKERVTIRQALSEQAGLAAIDHRLDPVSMRDPVALAAVIAGQAPEWEPGAWAGNHAHTVGWIASELIRRTDPQGRTLGAFFADEIAAPLGVDCFIGLPDDVDRSRLARIDAWKPYQLPFHLRTLPWRMVLRMFLPWTLTFRVLNNPSVVVGGPAALDTPEYWPVEDGGAGGISNARSLATIYGEFATGGRRLGLADAVLAELAAPAPRPTRGWRDRVLSVELHYSLALEKPSPDNRFGTDDTAYGTFAVGGSYAFADPTARLGYAYTTNKLGFSMLGDPREGAVRDAVYAALRGR